LGFGRRTVVVVTDTGGELLTTCWEPPLQDATQSPTARNHQIPLRITKA